MIYLGRHKIIVSVIYANIITSECLGIFIIIWRNQTNPEWFSETKLEITIPFQFFIGQIFYYNFNINPFQFVGHFEDFQVTSDSFVRWNRRMWRNTSDESHNMAHILLIDFEIISVILWFYSDKADKTAPSPHNTTIPTMVYLDMSVEFLLFSRNICHFDIITVEKQMVIQNWIFKNIIFSLFPPSAFNLEPPWSPNVFIKIIFSGNIKTVVLVILNLERISNSKTKFGRPSALDLTPRGSSLFRKMVLGSLSWSSKVFFEHRILNWIERVVYENFVQYNFNFTEVKIIFQGINYAA